MGQTRPGLGLSLLPVLTLIVTLSANVVIFGDSATSGPNQIGLLLSAVVAGLIGVFVLGLPYRQLEKKAIEAIGVSMQACLILLVVGSLIGLWILSGIVPTMIFYGMKMVNPSIFLVVSCAVCALVASATGSSWSTAGTIGLAIVGIGQGLGVPLEMVAGAIISGSYFGDKMSPLSDTTNLAPAMAGAELFEHIKHMFTTTVPSLIIALIGFFILGLSYDGGSASLESITAIENTISSTFNVGPHLLIVPVLVLIMVAKKIPALPALIAGTVLGGLFAVLFQEKLFIQLESTNAYKTILSVAYDGMSIKTGNEVVDSLFSRGGMSGILGTVCLIIMAMIYGGIMEETGMLGRLAQSMLAMVKGVGSLVSATVGSAIFLNLTASDQYLSLVVTGKMFKKAFDDMGLHPKQLSRTLEDSGTVTSVLVPWNTCGAYFASVLGVSTMAYLPYCFFNIACPIISVALATRGISVAYRSATKSSAPA